MKPCVILSTLCNFSCKLFCKTLRDRLQETLDSVTYLATAEYVASQVAETVAESRTRFYFLQRFQATIRFVAQSHEPVAKRKRLCNFSCNFSLNALRETLHKFDWVASCDSWIIEVSFLFFNYTWTLRLVFFWAVYAGLTWGQYPSLCWTWES